MQTKIVPQGRYASDSRSSPILPQLLRADVPRRHRFLTDAAPNRLEVAVPSLRGKAKQVRPIARRLGQAAATEAVRQQSLSTFFPLTRRSPFDETEEGVSACRH